MALPFTAPRAIANEPDASETVSGDRNRAIAYLLRTSHVLKEDVNAVLETYFRQCAILVTAAFGRRLRLRV